MADDAGEVLLRLPMADDLHVHLREGPPTKAYCKAAFQGGSRRVLVMPNTSNPISTCRQAKDYYETLRSHENRLEYLMTLYLSDAVKPDDIKQNSDHSHVQGVKVYPKGVTTNSSSGTESLEPHFPVFRELERSGLSLHIHGEVPQVHPLHAEKEFLPELHRVARAFPSLKIVLEHISTRSAAEAVKSLPNVGATVTAHHLELTCGDVINDENGVVKPHNFCKPLAKTEDDLAGIREVVASGHPRFFLGSDSAPHPVSKKAAGGPLGGTTCPAAGVFTSPFLLTYIANSFHSMGSLSKMTDFVSRFGGEFFGLHPINVGGSDAVEIVEQPFSIPSEYKEPPLAGDEIVVPWRAGQILPLTARVVTAS